MASPGTSAPGAAPGLDHYRDLDGIRGVLAVVIMLYHFGIEVAIERATFGMIVHSPWGTVVDFFFVLSGFVLARAYLLRPRGAGQVLVERAFRLLPVHLVLMALFAPLYLRTLGGTAPGILADLTATSVFLETARWNGPSWSINLELYLPVLLVIALPWVRRMSLPVLTLCLIALLALEGWLSWLALEVKGDLVLRGLAGLGAGVILFRIGQERGLPDTQSPWLLPLMTALMLAWITLSGALVWLTFFTPLLMVAIIWFGARSRSLLGRGPFALLGLLSYTIYMAHANVKAQALDWLGLADFGGSYAAKAVLIPAVILFAALLTYLVELPGMRLGRAVSARLGREIPPA